MLWLFRVGRAFTVLAVLAACLSAMPALAQDEAPPPPRARVVLLRPAGEIPEERIDAVEDQVSEAITAAGFEPTTEGIGTPDGAPPTTANEMRAIAELQRAEYVVFVRVTPGDHFATMLVRVGYAPAERVEEIELTISDGSHGRQRLVDVLRAMLRPDGVGADAERLVEESHGDMELDAAERTEQTGETDEERARREAEEAARREAADREAARRLQEQRDAEARFAGREQYGSRAPILFEGGVDVRALLSHDDTRTGGVLGGLSLRLGYALPGVTGLEIRGFFDLVTGATQGFALGGGAAFLVSPWEYPVFLGGTVEAGYFQGLSGNRVPSFLVRVGGLAVWRFTDDLYLEASLPEFQVLTANSGVLSLGVSVRLGFRF